MKTSIFEKKDENKGFTLVEILVVLVILAIFLSVVVPSYIGYFDKAKKRISITNCATVVRTAEAYLIDTEQAELVAPYENIKRESNVSGEINDIQSISRRVTYLKYTEGYVVIYQNGVYTIDNEASSGSEDLPVLAGYIMTDLGGSEHIFEAEITNEEFKDSMEESQSDGINISQGTILKEGSSYYIVGWNDWFPKGSVDKNISEYANVISLSGSKVYTAADKVQQHSNMVWPNLLAKGTICFDGVNYYVAPESINIYTMPPGGWVKIKY